MNLLDQDWHLHLMYQPFYIFSVKSPNMCLDIGDNYELIIDSKSTTRDLQQLWVFEIGGVIRHLGTNRILMYHTKKQTENVTIKPKDTQDYSKTFSLDKKMITVAVDSKLMVLQANEKPRSVVTVMPIDEKNPDSQSWNISSEMTIV